MLHRFLSVAGLAVTLAAGVLGTGLAASAAAPEGAGASKLRIELDCEASPETVELTNRSNRDLEIRSVGSLVDRRNEEPVAVDETLARGKSITFESGEDARGDVLTKAEIFDDEINGEGVVVRTSEGTFRQRC